MKKIRKKNVKKKTFTVGPDKTVGQTRTSKQFFGGAVLASTLVFLDSRKINLTEMMTFLVSLRDLQFY